MNMLKLIVSRVRWDLVIDILVYLLLRLLQRRKNHARRGD